MIQSLFKKIMLTSTLCISLATGCASSHSCISEKRHYYRHTLDEIPQHIACKSKYIELTGKQFDKNLNLEDVNDMLLTCREAKLTCLAATLERRIMKIPAAIFGLKNAGEYEASARLSEEYAAIKKKEGNLTESEKYLFEAKNDYTKAFHKYHDDDKCNTHVLAVAERLGDTTLLTQARAALLTEGENTKNKDYSYASELCVQLGDIERALWNNEKGGYTLQAAELALQNNDLARALYNYEQLPEHKTTRDTLSRQYARQLEQQDTFLLALDQYERLQDWSSAARCAEKASLYGKAILYYKKSGQINHARATHWKARKYISLIAEEGEFTKAAFLAEQIGDQILTSKLLQFARAHSKSLCD